jgi:hypothetical protein
MRRIAVHIAIILGLIIPLTSPASATEKCLANIPDSEWSKGYPTAVGTLLGFDLVQKITKSPDILPSKIIHPFYFLGDHTETYTYNYVGKYCLSRDVVVSRVVNQQSVTFSHQNLNEFASKLSRNFLEQENSLKFYGEARSALEEKSIQVVRQSSSSSNFNVTISPILETLGQYTKYQPTVVPLLATFIYFPTKCGYFKQLDNEGIEGKEKIYASLVSGTRAGQSRMLFESTGICMGELRQGGTRSTFFARTLPEMQGNIAEKIADIRYVVTDPVAPAVITCKKGKVTTKVKGANAKCPKGFKKV